MDDIILHLLSQRTIVQDILNIMICFLILKEETICSVLEETTNGRSMTSFPPHPIQTTISNVIT